MANIISILRDSVARFPNRVALIEASGRKWTFQEFDRLRQRKKAYLQQKGINQGDRVLVLLPMSLDLYVNVLALFSIGAVPVFLDQWISRKVLGDCLEMVPCKALIGGLKLRLASRIFKATRGIKIRLSPKGLAQTGDSEIKTIESDKTALITFTTGSTATPKAADRTHGFLKAQFEALRPILEERDSKVDLPMLPIVLLLNLAIGRTSVIPDHRAIKPGAFDGAKILDQIFEHEVESITTSPYFMQQIGLAAKGEDVPLRVANLGGGPVFPKLAESILASIPDLNIRIVYGSTEAEPIGHGWYTEQAIGDTKKGLWVGKVDEHASVRIIQSLEQGPGVLSQQAFDALDLPQGEVGEIVVSGAHVLNSYINNPAAVKENKIAVGDNIWHRTGDLGSLSADGTLRLFGRLKEMIIRANNKLFPFILQAEINNWNQVKQSAMLVDQEDLCVCIEGDFSGTEKEAIEKKLLDLLKTDFRLFWMKIPMDPRHQSKINYVLLKSLLPPLFSKSRVCRMTMSCEKALHIS